MSFFCSGLGIYLNILLFKKFLSTSLSFCGHLWNLLESSLESCLSFKFKLVPNLFWRVGLFFIYEENKIAF
jgi:hypothetical protein